MPKKNKADDIEIKPLEVDLDNKNLKEFLVEYHKLCEKYGLDVGAKLEVHPSSIEAVPFIFKVKKDVQSKS